MKTTKDDRERWKGQADEGLDVVEGVHDEIFLALIADVDELEWKVRALTAGRDALVEPPTESLAVALIQYNAAFLKEPKQ